MNDLTHINPDDWVNPDEGNIWVDLDQNFVLNTPDPNDLLELQMPPPVIEEVPVPTWEGKRHSLCLHAGGRRITKGDLALLTPPTNERGDLWFSENYEPYPHIELVDDILYNVEKVFGTRAVVVEEEYAIRDVEKRKRFKDENGQIVADLDSEPIHVEGAHFWGVMRLKLDDSTWEGDNLSTIIGIRSCWDGSFRPGVTIGNWVFICDNLAFSGESVVLHRSTKSAPYAISGSIRSLLRKLPVQYSHDQVLRETCKDSTIDFEEGCAFLGRLYGASGIGLQNLSRAFKEWQEPSFNGERTLWSLFNALTYSHKHLPLHRLITETQKISNFFKEKVVLNIIEPEKFTERVNSRIPAEWSHVVQV